MQAELLSDNGCKTGFVGFIPRASFRPRSFSPNPTYRPLVVLSERVIRFRWNFFAGLLLYASASVGAADRDAGGIPVLTVCQALRDSTRYRGQIVIVVGRSVGTSEGSWVDENCGLDLVIEGRKYPTAISTSYVVSQFAAPPSKPHGFKWDKRLLQRTLADVKRTTRLEYGAHWVAVYGRLETAATRTIALGAGQIATTSGHGHLSAASAQIVAGSDAWLTLR
jgi:hypothetical protein